MTSPKVEQSEIRKTRGFRGFSEIQKEKGERVPSNPHGKVLLLNVESFSALGLTLCACERERAVHISDLERIERSFAKVE